MALGNHGMVINRFFSHISCISSPGSSRLSSGQPVEFSEDAHRSMALGGLGPELLGMIIVLN